jgi:hypothetical protein
MAKINIANAAEIQFIISDFFLPRRSAKYQDGTSNIIKNKEDIDWIVMICVIESPFFS